MLHVVYVIGAPITVLLAIGIIGRLGMWFDG